MTPSGPPSSTAGSKPGNLITAALAQQSGKPAFNVTSGRETLALLDSGSLNRWAAVGIVDRHKLTLSEEGVTIDGKLVRYDDAQGPEELERILNRPKAPAPPHTHLSPGQAAKPTAATARVSDATFGAALTSGLRVTREGFEFHVVYQTRFGQTKTEKLEAALEAFQNMRVFRPHISLQKSGIRLVVTRWDGESFVEEPGIENLEHATPEEVEALIKNKLVGGTDQPANAVSLSSKPAVVRVEVLKKPHESRFHLQAHRQNGTTEAGPLLIRPNMAKLLAEGWFRPDVSISMTAMNDRIVLEQNAPGTAGRQTDTWPLQTVDDAEKLAAVLNTCLKPPHDSRAGHSPAPAPIIPQHEPEPTQPIAPLAKAAEEPAPAPTIPIGVPETTVQGSDLASPVSDELAPVEPPVVEPEEDHSSTTLLMKAWVEDLARQTAAIEPGVVNSEIFAALRDWFERPVSSNDHGFPAFSVEFPGKEKGMEKLEVVLTPHYLLCNLSFGYARFGPETRLFLTRLDDYVAFPNPSLRAVVERPPLGAVSFLVSDEFIQFLNSQADRNYKNHFAEVLMGMDAIVSGAELIWPLSREERLFQIAAATAKGYSLPVTQHKVTLDPNAGVFIGFQRATPEGMEFRDGEDYVRFCPVEVELFEDGEAHRFTASSVLLGWALDREGHVCAVYRKGSGFLPPEQTKLLRFLTEAEAKADENVLTQLAWLSADVP